MVDRNLSRKVFTGVIMREEDSFLRSHVIHFVVLFSLISIVDSYFALIPKHDNLSTTTNLT